MTFFQLYLKSAEVINFYITYFEPKLLNVYILEAF